MTLVGIRRTGDSVEGMLEQLSRTVRWSVCSLELIKSPLIHIEWDSSRAGRAGTLLPRDEARSIGQTRQKRGQHVIKQHFKWT